LLHHECFLEFAVALEARDYEHGLVELLLEGVLAYGQLGEAVEALLLGDSEWQVALALRALDVEGSLLL